MEFCNTMFIVCSYVFVYLVSLFFLNSLPVKVISQDCMGHSTFCPARSYGANCLLLISVGLFIVVVSTEFDNVFAGVSLKFDKHILNAGSQSCQKTLDEIK